MSSEDYFKLLCIPQDGIPFEAIGSHRARRSISSQPDRVIMELVKIEFDDDIIPARPFSINPDLGTYNKTWLGVEKIIEVFNEDWLNGHARVCVFASKNYKLHGYNKYVKGDGYRPTGKIYIWISSEEYSMYDLHLEQKFKKLVHPNIHTWSRKENKLNIPQKTSSPIQEQCRCYTCLKPNLSWALANL